MPVGPLQTQVYVDPLLTDLSIAYQNDNYIADVVFPEVQVKRRTGIYYVYDKAKFHTVNDLRAPGTRSNRVEYGLSKATYGPLLEHSLEQDIPDEVRDEAMQPLDPEMDATENLTERIMLGKEVDAFTQMNNTSTITQNTTLSGTSQWSDLVNSTPITDVQTGIDTVKKAILKKPNLMIMGYEVFSKLRNHPTITDRIKYSQLGIVTEELLAQVFGIDKIVIADAESNSANEGQADSMGYVWGKNVWIVYSNPAPAIRRVSFGYTFRMGPRQVLTWDQREIESSFVKVKDYYQQLIIAASACYFIKNAVA